DERDGKEYVHKLGNLTLLSGRKNIQASDDEFDKKIQIYKGKGKHNNLDEKITSFRITQQIVDLKNSGDLNKWSIDTINDRKLSLLIEVEKILNIDLSKIK
ncbi:HNH endonuclease family protein, partial [Flavobacteriales bacterium]|nr:HNH endonuclease family protein [Flavobacteriales bacterium]